MPHIIPSIPDDDLGETCCLGGAPVRLRACLRLTGLKKLITMRTATTARTASKINTILSVLFTGTFIFIKTTLSDDLRIIFLKYRMGVYFFVKVTPAVSDNERYLMAYDLLI